MPIYQKIISMEQYNSKVFEYLNENKRTEPLTRGTSSWYPMNLWDVFTEPKHKGIKIVAISNDENDFSDLVELCEEGVN